MSKNFEIEYHHHQLCLFCCKSVNYRSSEIKTNYNYEGQVEGERGRGGDYFNFNGDSNGKPGPLVSKIIDSEDSFGGFMEMLGRYSGGGVGGYFNLKELNCCDHCLIIISRCGELYEQLKSLEREIEWKVGSVMEIMRMGSGRMEGVEGNSTMFGGIRKEIMKKCFNSFKMLVGGMETVEPPPKDELPSLPPPPLIMPLPRKREKDATDNDSITDAAPAIKKSRIMTTTKPENMNNDMESKPKIISSAKESIPLDTNNNSNTNNKFLTSTVAMDTLEPEGGQVTFTLSWLQINKDHHPKGGGPSLAASYFFGSSTNSQCEGARAHLHSHNHSTAKQTI